MGKIIRKKIEYAGGSGDGPGKIWSGTDGIDVDNTTNTISANNTLARTSQVPTKVSELPNDAGYQNASEVDSKINSAVSSVFTYKGTVATTSALPNNASTGDVYNVAEDGLNYAYNGSAWTPLAGTFDTSGLIENPTTKTAGQILEYNGTQWEAVDKKIKYWDGDAYGSYPFVPSGIINATDTRTPQQPAGVNYMQVFHQMENGTCRAINISGKSEESGGVFNGMEYYEKDTPTSQWVRRWVLDCNDTGWQMLNGQYIRLKYRKKNGVVYLDFNHKTVQTLSANTDTIEMGVLPDGFRPGSVVISGILTSAGENTPAWVTINQNGDIRIHPFVAIPGDRYLVGSLSYPAA